MANQPYMPLYTGDWKKDPELSLCSSATRGIWIDLLCSFHDGRIGQVTGTPAQLARLCRCNDAEMTDALLDLQITRAADVSERDGVFTVTCRRMKKALDISKARAESGRKGGSKPKAKDKEGYPPYESEDEGVRKVREFARGEGIQTRDADWFFWKCHANGWTNGGKPILDWKATMRSWQRAGYLPSQKNGRLPSPVNPSPKVVKPQPAAWGQWLKDHYPDAKEQDFWRVPDDVKREFSNSIGAA